MADTIILPFTKFRINKNKVTENLEGKIYYIVFKSFDGTVSSYQNISTKTLTKGTSLIQLELKGTNKNKIEEYLNATIELLDRDQKEQKIEYATNTRKYIQSIFLKSGDS